MRITTSKHSNQQSIRPTRLLDLTKLCLDRSVALVHGSTLPGSFQYTTLSHRWGSVPSISLTGISLSALFRGVRLDTLPRLFQDACILTKCLAFDYIWIDCLCIIQGDFRDWQIESSLMSTVYMGSALNIAAHASNNSSQSLFAHRNPLAILPLQVHSQWEKEATKQSIMIWKSRDRPFATGVLHNRAWVFQERLLSPRTVHFTSTQVIWECRTTVKNDSHTRPPLSSSFGPHEGALKRHFDDVSRLLDSSNPFFRSWNEVVGMYSSAEMTEERDKLVAISGIASIMSRATGGLIGRYYAGLWEYNFASQLAWRVQWPHYYRTVPPPQTYRTPSWSWAALNCGAEFTGMIMFPERSRRKFLAYILHVETSTGLDPFGMVTSGCLLMKGHLMMCMPIESPGFPDEIALQIGQIQFGYVSFDANLGRLMPDIGLQYYFVLLLWQRKPRNPNSVPQSKRVEYPDRWDYDPRFPGDGHERTLHETSEEFLTTGLQRCHIDVWPTYHITGLILRPTGMSNGQFQRIGLFEDKEIEYETVSEFVRVMQQQIPPKYFRNYDANLNVYTFEIV